MLWFIFVVICCGLLKFVGEMSVWILMRIGFVFFIEVVMFEFVDFVECFFKKIFEGFKILVSFFLCILKMFILFVELKWFFIVCKIWNVWWCFFLKYKIVLIICFNSFGFVIDFFFVMCFMIKIGIFFVFVIFISLVVYFLICDILFGVDVMLFW